VKKLAKRKAKARAKEDEKLEESQIKAR